MHTQFILYVANQTKSTDFYSQLLGLKPVLFVEGMTEFKLNEHTKLGIMPEKGIAKLFPKNIPRPSKASGIPRCELYLKVKDVQKQYNHSISLGATPVNKPKIRDWGDFVGYLMDFDGHIIAFFS